jgi:MtrB/PioB family decaheme-associated outer membrane protein
LASAPVALPPDNQAHQFYFSGTHAYSATTRTNFKLAYTHATQNVDFQSMGLSPGSASNLGGVVDTTLAQLGLTMRPIKDLSINSSLRFEERMDKTPIVVYNYGKAGTALDATTNWPSGSQTRTTAKVDGVYRLPDGYSLTMGADWERKKSPLPPPNTAIYAAGGIIFRETLDETGLRAGMRKAMAENLNGALSLEYKERRSGEDWKTGANTAGNPIITVDSTANNVFPDLYMDRDRTKLRGNLDWDATERLSFQAVMEHGQDDYKRAWTPVLAQLTPIVAGARTINNDSITLDSSYKITDNWQVTSFLTHSENRWNVNKVSIGDDTKNRTDTLGVSLRGKATARLELGVDLLMSSDVTSFSNVVATSNVGGVGNIAGYGATPGNYLPTITYNTTKLNLSGVYSIDKKSAIKMNVIYQEYKNDDWQWGYNGTPFLYSDNTTVSSPASQSTTFIGAVYQYKF